jgi:hypothetical protein
MNYIFGYLSLVSFDKKEFMIYITNYKAHHTIYTREFDQIAFDMDDCYRNNPPYTYGCVITRVIHNI